MKTYLLAIFLAFVALAGDVDARDRRVPIAAGGGGGGGPALYDNSAEGFSASAATTISTASFAVGGTNRVLYCFAGIGAGSPAAPSGVVWNTSEAMTQISTTLTVTSAGRFTLWRLINPTATTAVATATYGVAQDERLLICISVKDANQSSPNTTVVTATGGPAGPMTVTATGLTSGMLVIDGQFYLDEGAGNRTITAGGTQSSKQEIEGSDTGGYEGMGVSTETAAGTTQVMSWAFSPDSPAAGAWGSFTFGVPGL